MHIKTFTEYTLCGWTATVEVVFETSDGGYFEHEIKSFTSPAKSIKGILKFTPADVDELKIFESIVEFFEEDTGFADHLERFESEFREEIRGTNDEDSDCDSD